LEIYSKINLNYSVELPVSDSSASSDITSSLPRWGQPGVTYNDAGMKKLVTTAVIPLGLFLRGMFDECDF
jgi:hypothetical protein